MTNEVPKDIARKLFQIEIDNLKIDLASTSYKEAPDNKRGRRTQKKAIAAITEEILGFMSAVSDLEIESSQKASDLLGVDFLVTDSSGSRSIVDLENGRPLGSGCASRCVAVIVCHDDVGIGASHRNTANETVVKRYITNHLKYETFQDRLSSISPTSLDLFVSPPSILMQTMSKALNEAIEKFRSIIPGDPIPQEGVVILAAGMDFLDQSTVLDMEQSFTQAISRNYHFNDGSMKGRNRTVSLETRFGEACGIIWGGPHHPMYNEPRFYTLESKS